MAQEYPAATPVDGSSNGRAISARKFGAWLTIPTTAAIVAAGMALCWSSQYFVDYEMSLLPWLISHDWVLYRDAIDQHTPLLPALLVLAGAGDPAALHYVIVGLNLAILVLTWLVAWRMGGRVAGLLAVVFAEVWLTSFESTHLWYDIALAPFYLGIVLALCAEKPFKGSLSAIAGGVPVGFLVGTATMIKQHAVLALPLAALMLYRHASTSRRARLAGVLGGFALPVLAAGAYYAANSALNDALYWTVVYTFNGDYPQLASLGPAPGEWPTLALLYAPIAAASLMLIADHLSSMRIMRNRGTLQMVAHLPGERKWQFALLSGMVAIATLPAYPRYGRFHLAAAVPLLGVIGGVLFVHLAALTRTATSSRSILRIIVPLTCLLVAASFVWGAFLWLRVPEVVARNGTPQAPYANSITPLRSWLDSHAPPGAPVAMYGLDPLLLRVLEREPTRPFIPQLPWIFFKDGREAQWWSGAETAQPSVALVSSTGWADSPQPGVATIEGRLRYHYREAARFSVTIYPGASHVNVVCLLRQE